MFDWQTTAVSSSFPSGHAMSATVTYGTVAYLVIRLQKHTWARVLTGIAASLLILLICSTRLYLGVHYPSDVIAGIIVGLAWAGFCMATLEASLLLGRRRAPQDVSRSAARRASRGRGRADRTPSQERRVRRRRSPIRALERSLRLRGAGRFPRQLKERDGWPHEEELGTEVRQGGGQEREARHAQAEVGHPQERAVARKVKSRDQAIAIGLSEAREKGAKVPRKRSSKKSTSKRSGAKKSSARRKSTTKKSSAEEDVLAEEVDVEAQPLTDPRSEAAPLALSC